MTQIFPVIHYRNSAHALREAEKIALAGCAGTFLISHANQDEELLRAAVKVKLANPKLKVGVNLLSMDEDVAFNAMTSAKCLDAVWFDQQVSSTGLNVRQQNLRGWCEMFGGLVFAGVAFKYQSYEPHPFKAARIAYEAGFIPTTSGDGTGQSPTLEKIITMSEACEGHLAVASGMTPENIKHYAPYLAYALVATSIVDRNDCIVPDRLKQLMENVK